MPFKIIWDIGGFVISELIKRIKEEGKIEFLAPNSNGPFVRKEEKGDKYYFISRSDANEVILQNYSNYVSNKKVKFKSRFFPSDYLAILYTLVFLREYEYEFSSLLKEIYLIHREKTDLIQRMLFSLYLITYWNIGLPDSGKLGSFKQNLQYAILRSVEIRRIISDEIEFNRLFANFKKDRIFKQKRAWCSLRDYLKSPEFKIYFKGVLQDKGLNNNDFDKLFSYFALSQLELPGDVWNNNSKFRRCVLKNSKYENSRASLNKILREFFEENPGIEGYPEQFDVTFDFVPRMCEQNNCDICPIYKIDNKENMFSKVCFGDEQKYCPVSLVSCNYKGNCIGVKRCRIA
jgi:hypothetical protein